MRRFYKSVNGFSPETNRLVGSLTYLIFHLFIFWISYKIWGIKMFDKVWFYLMHIVTFFSVRFFLISIGFWKY